VRAGLAVVVLTLAVPAAGVIQIPYEEAKPILEANARNISAAEWPAWVAKRNAEIRGRLAQGDEDSIVNLWLYGTSFTKLPRVTDREAALLAAPEKIQDLLLARLDDFVAALAKPGTNERLQFARDLVTRKGITLATEAGRDRAKAYLVETRERVIAENERFRRAAASPSEYSTLFRDRGLSSDTRLMASFAIDTALAALAGSGRISAASVTRVAIIGPGLDFTDKAEGYDFYPLQTIQPFAVADSLARLNLAPLAALRITTLDLSPRVNRHLAAARRRAGVGSSYVIQLPLAKDQPSHEWHPDLVAYWQRFGSTIGKTVPAAPAPAIAGDVRVRAIAVRPSIVTAITPEDVDIIVERLDPLPDSERFDLIIATNILVYYDAFEQSLALANISKMLKPGGLFLTNYAVTPMAPMDATASQTTAVFFDRQQNGDTVFAYRKR
jgi:SAM-dependent methyltransferase